MPKRSVDRPYQKSRFEQARVNQKCYGQMESDEMKKLKTPLAHKEQERNKVMSDIILRNPSAGDARKCYECECTNSQGFCDNYLLHAVMRQTCRKPVKVAT